jgi:hypothetical protein
MLLYEENKALTLNPVRCWISARTEDACQTIGLRIVLHVLVGKVGHVEERNGIKQPVMCTEYADLSAFMTLQYCHFWLIVLLFLSSRAS